MKEISLRRSLSERKLAKKKDKNSLDRSLTPISIIGDKRAEEPIMTGDSDNGVGTLDIRLRKNKFWKLKVSCFIFLR